MNAHSMAGVLFLLPYLLLCTLLVVEGVEQLCFWLGFFSCECLIRFPCGKILLQVLAMADSEVETLSLGAAEFSMEEAQGLSAVLGEKHSIKSLVIARGFKDSWKSICALGTVLKEVPHLEHLSLAGLRVDGFCLEPLSCPGVCSHLRILQLNENRLGECGGRHVATLVENAPCLRVLRLEDGGLGDEGVAHLCKGLQSASCLVELTLAGNNIGDQGASALAGVLGTGTPPLKLLSLAGIAPLRVSVGIPFLFDVHPNCKVTPLS